MTKSETSKAPELSKRGGHRPHRNSTTSSKKPGSEMVVEEVARLTLADVSVGGKSGLKGGIPTPNAIPAPLSNGNGAPSGEKPKKPRGGKGKGKNKLKQFDVSQKVWVGGITEEVTWKALQELADTVGKSKWVEVLPKGQACVVYGTAEEAQTAIATLNGSSAGDIVLQFDVWAQKEKA